MSGEKIIKEKNNFIYKYQKEDINKRLGRIFGEKYVKYRDDFNKAQNYLETKFIPDFPLMISMEFFNRCNLNCVMCYKKHHTYPEAELNLEIVAKILEECQDNKMPSITLGSSSELLMYKNADKVLDMVRDAGILDVFLATNGVLLTDEIIESIIKNKISRVRISLDAATEEIYNKVRRVPVLPKIEENINKLIAAREKHKSSLPIVRLSFVVMDINQHEVQKFINKWGNKVDYIDFQRFISHDYVDKEVDIKPEAIKDCFCSQPFYSLNVWADGRVTPCCTFYGKKLILGNVYKDNLRDIWHGKQMAEIREQIINKKFNKVCQRCLYFRDNDLIDGKFKNNEI